MRCLSTLLLQLVPDREQKSAVYRVVGGGFDDCRAEHGDGVIVVIVDLSHGSFRTGSPGASH
jgi:hypothetical protein